MPTGDAAMNSDEIDLMLFGPRTCTACGHTFSANSEHFGRDRTRPDGITSHCRLCRGRRDKSRYASDPALRARKREWTRQWRQEKTAHGEAT